MKSRDDSVIGRGGINRKNLFFIVPLCIVLLLIGFFYPAGHKDVEDRFPESRLYSVPAGSGSFYFFHDEGAIVSFNFIPPDPVHGNSAGVEIPTTDLEIGKSYRIDLEIKDGYDRDWPGIMELRLVAGDVVLWKSDIGRAQFFGWKPVRKDFTFEKYQDKLRVELHVTGNPTPGSYWGHQGPFGIRNITIVDSSTGQKVESIRVSYFNSHRLRIILLCVFLCAVLIVAAIFVRNITRIILRAFAYLVYLLVVTIILAEIICRVFDPMGVKNFPAMRRYFQNMIFNDKYAYIHKPGYRDKLQGAEILINSLGLRSPELSRVKKRGILRLMILGDSITFGWGVTQDEILSAQLQEMLDAAGRKWEVINAGVGSWNTRTEYEFIKDQGSPMDIDVIVLLISSNDIDPKSTGHTYINKDLLFKSKARNVSNRVAYPPDFLQLFRNPYQFMIEKSYLFSNIYWLVKTRKTVVQKLSWFYRSDSPAWLDTKNALECLVDYCNENNIKLMVYIYRMDETFAEYFLWYENVVKEKGLMIYSFPTHLYDRKYWNSPIDRHPNAEGHTIMASQIFEDLLAGR